MSETITRNVRELSSDERRLIEGMIGHELAENQQVVLQVLTINASSKTSIAKDVSDDTGSLPNWTQVYRGLNDIEVSEVETVILKRSDLTRPTMQLMPDSTMI